MSKVYITDYIKNPNIEKKILGKNLVLKKNKDVGILLVWHKIINEKYCKYFNKLKAVIRYGVGYDNIDLDYLNKNKILFCNTPDYGIDEVSDTALAAILNICRRIQTYNNNLKNYNSKKFVLWQENIIRKIRRTNKIKLGVIGAGRIGSSLLKKCRYLCFNCSFFDPYVSYGYEKILNVNRVFDLDNLLSNSDLISIHVPLTSETNKLVDENFIRKMKKGASLINTSRGPIIKHSDVVFNALNNNQLQSVYLDVLPNEPPNLEEKLYKSWINNEVWLNGRLIINPHTSYYSQESFREMRIKASENALRIIDNFEPINRISQ